MLGFYSPNPATAETYTATQTERDFYFESQEQVTMTLRTFAQQYGIDSMLWVYGANNTLVTQNDDYYGLDSFVSFTMEPGVTYRVRAGVCCGDPERWYGTSYVIEPSLVPINAPETTTTTSTTTTTTSTTTTTTIPMPENANWSMVNEGDTFELIAPNGYVFTEVTFASYGTPLGQSGRWLIGVCHAQNSMQIVEEYALGRSSFSIPATNSVFGDPCGGTPKRLAVTALYGPAPTTSTTSTTTTTEAPQPPPTTTLVSTTTLPPLVVTTSSSSTSTVPVTTTAVPSTTLPPETTTSTSTTLPVETTTTTIPVIDESLSPEEAIAIVTSAAVLQELTSEEAIEVFDSLEVSELTDEQAEVLIEAVQDAPEEVRAAFESEVNVFDNKFNNYVPLGSKISVGERKVLIAATGVLFMAPTVSVSSSTSGSTATESRKRK
jgi:hypothetical protein